MPAQQIVPGLYVISLRIVNVFLLESSDGLTLIDTGAPNSADRVLQAVGELGQNADDIGHIVLSHAHPDHIGSLAALKKATGAAAYMHPVDADIARTGTGFRPLTPAPGLITKILFRLFIRPVAGLEGAAVEHEVHDGDELPFAGGLKAIHVPGHCAGQLVFLWPQHGGVLFAADACANMLGLGWSLGYEDLEEGKQSLRKLAQLDFEIACFGHGKAITQNASAQFKKKWG